MHIHPSTIAAACLSLLPLASSFYPYNPIYTDVPTRRSPDRSLHRVSRPLDPRGHSYSLPIRRTPTKRTNKYNIITATPPTQSNSIAVDQDGTDFSYMVAVTFGTSSEEYHMLVDSAASNTWVMGSNCTTDACKEHNTFGKGDSTSLIISDTTFSIAYGTGQVSGNLATDTFHIAGFNLPLTFGLANNVSNDFGSYPMDGILGLGRGDSTSNTIAAPSLMDVLSSKSLIKSKLFGIHLSRTSSGVNDGELDFGAPNLGRYDGALNYIPTISNTDGFWEIAADDAGVDGKKLGLTSRSAIIDTGTSFILMPNDDAVALHKLIPGFTQGGETFTVPCSSTQVVQLVLGGVTYNVSAADYIGHSLGGGACASNIIGRQTFGPTQWLVGDVFLKNVYTVFDFDSSRLGFGVKGQVNTASATTLTAVPFSTTPLVSGSSTILSKSSPPTGTTAPTPASQQLPGASASPTHSVAAAGCASSGAMLALSMAFFIPAIFL